MRNILTLAIVLCSLSAMAVVPKYNVDPYSHRYTASQSFEGGITVSGGMTMSGALTYTGLSDVSGDALCLSGASVLGTCGAAVFTTSVSSPILLSPLTGSADDILIKPAGTTALTVSEGGNATLVGDLTVSGNDITAKNMSSAATGSADDMSFKPATVAVLNVAEAGEIQMMKKVTAHAACAAVGDIGRIELFGVADTVNLCVCIQSAADTFSWTPIPAAGAC